MWVIFLIIAITLLIISLFASKRFSPIPYFPTNRKDIALIIKSLDLKNNQIICDLGAGDGIVIFEAAKKAHKKKVNTRFIAVEINPVMILILNLRRFLHPNKKNIRIVWGDLFKMNFQSLTFDFSLLTFYLYISPWFLEKVCKKILDEFPYARIVSYMYPITSLQKNEKIIQGKNNIYIYN